MWTWLWAWPARSCKSPRAPTPPLTSLVAELLVELNKEKNVTLIVATHSMELAERMGEVWQLDGGRSEGVK